jgi:RNA polymerase sigma factor (sigma-70 family)
MKSTDGVAQNRRRFEELFASTRIGILGFFMRRASTPSDAADLLGETYLIAWRKMPDVPYGDQGRLWLYGVARRVLSNYHRHETVERRLADTLQADLGRHHAAPRAEDPYSEVVEAALRSLSPGDREIIELSAWEQLTPTEIARVIGMKPGAVRVRLHRIRSAVGVSLAAAGYPAPGHLHCAG